MKKAHLLSVLFLLLCNTLYAQAIPEIALDETSHYQYGSYYLSWAGYFTNVFKPKNGVYTGPVYDSTSFTKLDIIEPDTLRSSSGASISYFKVLRVLYGLDTNATPYRIKLIYLPDYAVLDTNTKQYKFQRASYPVPDTDTITVYTCDNNGNFVGTPYNVMAKTFVANYKHAGNLFINRYNVPRYVFTANDTLRFGYTDATMDAEEVTFSFQEFRVLLSTSKSIYITSIAHADDEHQNPSYKHSLAFSPYSPKDVTSATQNNVSSYVADLGSLCPLKCGDLQVIKTPSGTNTSHFLEPNADTHVFIEKNTEPEKTGHDKRALYIAVIAVFIALVVGILIGRKLSRNAK